MNIADYFKSEPDKPIDALIKELLENNNNSLCNDYQTAKPVTEDFADKILNQTNEINLKQISS
jgi:hypothetical protein